MSELRELLNHAARHNVNPFGERISSADMRTQNADFIVEEILGFEPEGEGEFLFLWLEKDGQNTDWVAGQLAQALNVRRSAVSYSGRKDRHAVTRQWFCVHWQNKEIPDVAALKVEGCHFISAERHPRKLRTGAHKANHFKLVLRSIDAPHVVVDERLELIHKMGVPNYYGSQRFGRIEPESQESANITHALNWLETEKAPHKKNLRSLYLSAFRSAMFNHIITARVTADNWHQALDGEYFVLDGARTGFDWHKKTEDWPQRLETMDIHPSVTLQGKGHAKSSQAVRALEQDLLKPFKPVIQFLNTNRLKIEQRASRLKVDALKWHWHSETELSLSFNLVRGAFATSVLAMIFDIEDKSFR